MDEAVDAFFIDKFGPSGIVDTWKCGMAPAKRSE
jgi:hypothetical protein